MRSAVCLALSTALLATSAVALAVVLAGSEQGDLAQGDLAQGDVTQGDLEKGKQVYTIYCVTCHGASGDGKGPVGVTLNPPPRDFTAGDFKFGDSDADIFDVITNGGAPKGGSPLMAPWGAVIPEPDRWSLVLYIRSLRK
jgi:mono/diheme cytochrome c family protein